MFFVLVYTSPMFSLFLINCCDALVKLRDSLLLEITMAYEMLLLNIFSIAPLFVFVNITD